MAKKQGYAIKNVVAALGNLEYCCCEGLKTETVGYGRDQSTIQLGYRYQLLSDTQDDVFVYVPREAGKLQFDFRAKVELVNPRIVPVPRSMTNRNGTTTGYVEYRIFADAIVDKM